MKKSVVICCAGTGTRLGKNIPKCLVEFNGKKVIDYELELFRDFDEIILVVGYKAEMVIDYVNGLNFTNIKFVVNDKVSTTTSGDSFYLGSLHAKNDMIVASCGDIIINPFDFKQVIDCNEEFVCARDISSQQPVLLSEKNGMAISIGIGDGSLEWLGLAGIKKEHIEDLHGYIYDVFKKILPIRVIKVSAQEIDTLNDYKSTFEWLDRGMK